MVKAQCQKRSCVSVDSWDYFLSCHEVPDIAELAGKGETHVITEICKKVIEPNPVRPRPSAIEYAGMNGSRFADSSNRNVILIQAVSLTSN